MEKISATKHVSEALGALPISVELQKSWSDVALEENYVPNAELPEMCFNDHLIGLADRDLNCETRVNGQTERYPLSAGDLLIMPAQQAFNMGIDREHTSIAILLTVQLLRRNADSLWGNENFELIHYINTEDSFIKHARLALRRELMSNPYDCQVYAQTMANALAVHLLSCYSIHSKPIRLDTGKLSSQKLTLVLEFIRGNLEQKITLEDLANLVQLSQFHFSRAFKLEMGISPYQYIIQQRVERAKILLKNSTMSLTDIALDCGFSHQSHLNRQFKRLTQTSPKVFQMQQQ